MGAALGRGDGVTVGLDETVARGRPVDRPFDLARHAKALLELDGARKRVLGIGRGLAQRLAQVVGQAAGEVEGRLHRRVAVFDLGLPADLDAGEEIGLGADHLEQARGFEAVRAKNLFVGVEGHGGAPAVGGRADLLHRALRDAAREALLKEFTVPRDLYDHGIAERVDHRSANPVQTARGLIGLARELAARVQGAEDHLERRFVGKLRVRVDRDAAAVVADGDRVIGVQLHLDPVGMARDSLVHRVVEHLGHHMVQRALIGAADIHAGTFADGLQPLQHFDGGGIVFGGFLAGKKVGHAGLLFVCGWGPF